MYTEWKYPNSVRQYAEHESHVSWSTIEKDHGRDQKRYGMRADLPDFLTNSVDKAKYDEKTCKFEDYFEILPQYKGHETGKQYGI